MDILRRFAPVLFALPILWGVFAGCDDDNGVTPPPPPPQIALERISGMASDDVYDVLVDHLNHLWISTEAGLYLFSSPVGPFPIAAAGVWLTDREGLPNSRCRGLDHFKGKLYVATWGGGIGVFDGALPFEAIRDTDGLPSGRVFDLAHDDTCVWVATASGVAKYFDNDAPDPSDRIEDLTDVFGPEKFTSIVVRDNVGGTGMGHVWVSQAAGDSVGTRVPGGIQFLEVPGTDTQFFTPSTSAIPSDDVAQVAYDPVRGLLWSAHSGKGVASLDLPAKQWTTYTMGNGLVSNLVGSVAVNELGTKWPAGTMWIATQAGVSRIDPDGTITNYAEGSGLPTVRVRKVVVTRNDDVWLCFVGAGAARVVPPTP